MANIFVGVCVCVCVTENQPLKAAGIFIIIIICYVMLCVFRFATLVRSLRSTLCLLYFYLHCATLLASQSTSPSTSQSTFAADFLLFYYSVARSHEQRQRRFASFAFTRFYFTLPLRFTRYVMLNVTLLYALVKRFLSLFCVCASHFAFILIPHALLLL